jgi:hypothetical protein
MDSITPNDLARTKPVPLHSRSSSAAGDMASGTHPFKRKQMVALKEQIILFKRVRLLYLTSAAAGAPRYPSTITPADLARAKPAPLRVGSSNSGSSSSGNGSSGSSGSSGVGVIDPFTRDQLLALKEQILLCKRIKHEQNSSAILRATAAAAAAAADKAKQTAGEAAAAGAPSSTYTVTTGDLARTKPLPLHSSDSDSSSGGNGSCGSSSISSCVADPFTRDQRHTLKEQIFLWKRFTRQLNNSSTTTSAAAEAAAKLAKQAAPAAAAATTVAGVPSVTCTVTPDDLARTKPPPLQGSISSCGGGGGVVV